MFFDEARERFLPVRPKIAAVLALSGLFVLLAFLPLPYAPGGAIVSAAEVAAKSFRF